MKITIRTIDIIFTYKICRQNRQNAKTPFVFAKKSFTKRSPEIQYFPLLKAVWYDWYVDFFKRDLCPLRWKNDIDIMQMTGINSQVQDS